jgi:hypothetical protein
MREPVREVRRCGEVRRQTIHSGIVDLQQENNTAVCVPEFTGVCLNIFWRQASGERESKCKVEHIRCVAPTCLVQDNKV